MRQHPIMRMLSALALSALLCASHARAQDESAAPPVPAQRSFASPDAAVDALISTLRADPGAGRVVAILGAGSATALRSGDPVADRAARERFLAAFDTRHEIRRTGAGEARLVVGPDNWPFPFPIREERNRWRFDSRAGAQELIDRRIGRNELDAVQALLAIADAQDDFRAMQPRSQGLPAYARRFWSSPGQRDGLYWESAPGEPESPLGPLAAAASAGGYRTAADGRPQPFHGYYFRILEGQGPSAPGGAADYVLNGRMIGGFAVIAWPARHNVSGIMTFAVNQQGAVYQANLGPQTDALARRIRIFEPGEGWTRVEP